MVSSTNDITATPHTNLVALGRIRQFEFLRDNDKGNHAKGYPVLFSIVHLHHFVYNSAHVHVLEQRLS